MYRRGYSQTTLNENDSQQYTEDDGYKTKKVKKTVTYIS